MLVITKDIHTKSHSLIFHLHFSSQGKQSWPETFLLSLGGLVSEGIFMFNNQASKLSKHYNFLGIIKDSRKKQNKTKIQRFTAESCGL